MDAAAANQPREIGSILVERHLVTAAQLQEALRLQERTGAWLGEILITEFGVSRPELQRVLAEEGQPATGGVLWSSPAPTQQWQAMSPQSAPAPAVPLRRPIGEIFVELGFVSAAQLEAALVEQHRTGARIGEILIAQGSLTRFDLASALAEHWEPVIPESEAGGHSPSGPAARADREVPGTEPVRGPRTRHRSLVPRARITDWISERQDEPAAATPAPRHDVQAELAELRRSLEDLGAVRAGDALATGARLAGIETAIAGLADGEARVHEDAGRDLAAHFEALAARLERIEGQLEAAEPGLADELRAEAAARAADQGSRLEAESEETAALRARVDELEEEASRLRADAEQATAAWRNEAGSLAARIDELLGLRHADAQAARAASDRLDDRMDELGRRLDAQAAIGEEQVRVTERALRKGLASLGERFVAPGATYTADGKGLRRSIERLGAAIIEADARLADEIPVTEAEGCVAFAPTAAGYRLVELPGAPPEIGATVELAECEGVLVVSRYGRSPLPFDGRPCAYLDRA